MESGFYAIRLHRENRFLGLDLRDGSMYAKKVESGDIAPGCVWYVDFLQDSRVAFLGARGNYITSKFVFFKYTLGESNRKKEQGPGAAEKFMLVNVIQDQKQCYFFKSSLGRYITVKIPELTVHASASKPSADSVFEFIKLESEESPIVF